MNLKNAMIMTRMGTSMSRTQWCDNDLILVETDAGLIISRSKSDPTITHALSDEDMAAMDWEVLRSE